MVMTESTLFDVIRTKIYKDTEIQEISENSQGHIIPWIFDFKSQSLNKLFLEEFSRFFWETFREHKNIQLCGMETGAIPLMAAISLSAPDNISLKLCYIRKSRKKSDLANLIEGELVINNFLIIIDDILNTGGTIKKQIQILKERGCTISAIFTCLRFRDVAFYEEFLRDSIRVLSIYELNDFSKVLPVKNIQSKVNSSLEEYEILYKVKLTNKPNLYHVLPKSGIILYDNFLYVGADDGNFFCLDSSNGDVVWVYKIPFGAQGKYIFSTPVVYKDLVLFGAYDGNFYCLNRLSGKREWVFMEADWIGSSPVVNKKEGVVFVGLEFGLFKKHGGIVALDILSGKVKWKNYSMDAFVHGSPAYNEKQNMVVCGCNNMYVYGIRANTGEVVWEFLTQGEVKYGATFIEKENLTAIASMDGSLYLLNTETGSCVYEFKARFGFYSTPIVVGEYIIIGSLDKMIYCFDFVSKKLEWNFETQGRIFASPESNNGHVFIGSNDGNIYELNIKTGILVRRIQLTERILNKVCIEKDKNNTVIYASTQMDEIYKIKIKNE